MDSVGSMFSLSELRYSGSSKNLGLYSVSVRLEGHGPESEVILLSFFLWCQYSWKLSGTRFPIFSGFLPWSKFFSLLFCVLYQCMVASLSLDLYHQKYSIFWKVTCKEPILEITSRVQRSCHVL